MDRVMLIQALIRKYHFKNYLEIGVLNGYVFFQVRCTKKIAVDPYFRFRRLDKLKAIGNNLYNIGNKYFEKTSDAFFDSDAPRILRKGLIDISLVDGMHEFRFALNDANNSLKYLNPDGVVILHDCNPKSEDAACSYNEWEERGFAGEWNGDTWKAITYLIRNRPDLEVFTADCDYGLGIITKAKSPRKIGSQVSFEEIDRLSYKDLEQNRVEFLNLKPARYLRSFFNI
jgi:hypothetical protein